MRRPSRTPTIVLVFALLAIAGALTYYWWPSPTADPVPDNSSATPTATDSPSTPEPTPSSPSEPDPHEPLTHWSSPAVPECGEVFTGEEFDSALRFDLLLDSLSPEDPFPVTVRNSGTGPVITGVDRYDIAVPVLTDSTGTVVAMGSLEPVLAEGYSVLALEVGDETTVTGTLRWAVLCGDEIDPIDPEPLPPGEHELFLLASTVPDPDEGSNQIQGGPFPITIDPAVTHEHAAPGLGETGDVPGCGLPWSAPSDPTPGTIDLRSGPVDGPDGLVMTGTFSLEDASAGASVYAHIVIIDGGVVVGPYPHASDALVGWYASAGLGAPIVAMGEAVACTGEPLPPGTYEAVLVVSTIDQEAPTLAVSETVPFTVP